VIVEVYIYRFIR